MRVFIKNILLFLLPIFAIIGQTDDSNEISTTKDVRGGYAESYSPNDIVFMISSSKSRFKFNEVINLKFKIKNVGFYPVTIYIHTNYLKNFFISIIDSNGKTLRSKKIDEFDYPVDEKDEYNRNYSATVHQSRAIILHPNESFERVLNLRDLVDFPTNNINTRSLLRFDTKAYFYPNPEQTENFFIQAKDEYPIYLETNQENMNMKHEPPMNFLIKSKEIEPKEIVYLALNAEYASDWATYFKYISLNDLIKDYPDYAQEYMQSSDSFKLNVLEKFRNYLTSEERNKLYNFKILIDKEAKTEAMDHESMAIIKVKVIRTIEGFKRQFLCKYFLTKIDNFWLITGLEAKTLN